MASLQIRSRAVAAFVAATLTLLCLGAAAPAIAQDGSLKDFLFGAKRGESQRQAPPPPVARYVSETARASSSTAPANAP